MNRSLTMGLLFALSAYGESSSDKLAKYCLANTQREGIEYQPFPMIGLENYHNYRSCRASYQLKNGNTIGLSAIVPLKDGVEDYSSLDASLIISVGSGQNGIMFTDLGLDGKLDRVSVSIKGELIILSMSKRTKKLQKQFNALSGMWSKLYN